MAIGGIGEGVLSQHLQELEQIKSEQMSPKKVSLPPPGTPANIDRVDVSPLAKQSLSATPPDEKPQMYRKFDDEIEAAIEGISNIIRNSRYDEVTGGLMVGQKAEVINEPGRGVLVKDERRIEQAEQQYIAQREQIAADQSAFALSKASLTSIVENVANEQKSRNASVTSALH